jgi:hypothetical protein
MSDHRIKRLSLPADASSSQKADNPCAQVPFTLSAPATFRPTELQSEHCEVFPASHRMQKTVNREKGTKLSAEAFLPAAFVVSSTFAYAQS